MRVIADARLIALLVCLAFLTGCNGQNPFSGQGPFIGPATVPPAGTGTIGATPPVVSQEQLAQRQAQQGAASRLTALENDNQQLEKMLAQTRQQSQYLKEQTDALREQLKGTTDKLAQLQTDKLAGQRQIASLQASVEETAKKTTAAFKPNNSVLRKLRPIQMKGVEVRTDGDVVRVELPVDQLFDPDSNKLRVEGKSLIDSVSSQLQREYRDQLISVEGHTNSGGTAPGGNWTSRHELTNAQAIAVFNHLTARLNLPTKQLSVVGHGANHPVVSNGTKAGRARNRRVELVVYPESYR